VEVAGDTHAHGSETVEDVDFSAHVLWGVRDGLEHWIGESREDVMDLGEEEGKEARVTVTEDGEESHELVKVVAGSKGEGLWVGGKEGEDVGEGAGYIEEFLDLHIISILGVRDVGMGHTNPMP
jgi:hypothetical protein